MASNMSTVPNMNWDSANLSETWRKFKQHVELTFTGPLAAKTTEQKISYLLIWVGEKGRDIFNTWNDLTDANRKLLETYYTRFEAHVKPKTNVVFARYKFHNRTQESSDTFD